MPGICEISRLIFIESIYAIENITLQTTQCILGHTAP